MESKTVILVNTVLMTTFICEEINGTFIAFGGDVTFWKQKKFWYFTDNHITVILTIYREFHDIKRNVGIVFFSPISSIVSTSFVFERYLLVLILTRAIIIYSAILSFVKCSSRASAA